MPFEFKKFSDIDICNPFFDSLKEDYSEFLHWFSKKKDDDAYIFSDAGEIYGFLYLKFEDEPLNDITPPLPRKQRIKIGTFKVVAHGTRLGENFLKKAFDCALHYGVEELYITIFPKHTGLIKLVEKYGFGLCGTKVTANGTENVYLKSFRSQINDVITDYPIITGNNKKFVLGIYPEYHSRLFPESILKTENPNEIIRDVSHTNSIHKVYLTKIGDTRAMKPGDTIVIYRTSDIQNRAYYRSVCTSLCALESINHISDYKTIDSFVSEISTYSVFSEEELVRFYKTKRYPIILKFTYNCAFVKRVNLQTMIETCKINQDYWGFYELTNAQFESLIYESKINERYIVNQT